MRQLGDDPILPPECRSVLCTQDVETRGLQWLDGHCSWDGQDYSQQLALVCQSPGWFKKNIQRSRNSPLCIMKDVVFLFHMGLVTVAFSTTSQKEDAKHMRLQLKVTWVFWLAQDVSP